MMKKLLFPVLFIVTLSTYGQTRVEGTSYNHFQIKSQKDIIDFVIADTNLNVSKPLLLFCQGSQPVPLFFNFDEQGIFPVPLNNFNIEELNKIYHVAVISMPKTPVIVGRDHLNKSYNYVTDTTQEHSYSSEYLLADNMDNYVSRANAVLKYLLKQKWVDSKELIIAGHSQGSRIAVSIACSNKKVTKLGLFGYNPHGRVDQQIRQARKDAENGKITWEKADSIMNEQYDFYRDIQDEDTVSKHPSLVSWKSFSVATLDKLINLTIPIYIAYGSDDIVTDYCDLIPLYFIEKHKTNLTRKFYPNLEHNFFKIEDDGTIDYTKGRWGYVMNDFIGWTKK